MKTMRKHAAMRLRRVTAFLLAAAVASFPAESADERPPSAVARLAEQAARMLTWKENGTALERIEAGLAADPSCIPLWRLKAKAHIALEENAAADEALRVVLLYNPRDAEGRLLQLVNILSWNSVGKREAGERLAEAIRETGTAEYERILAEFVRREDFPVYMPRLLDVWREGGDELRPARELLALFASGRLSEARERLDATVVDSELRAGLANLLEREESGDLSGTWAIDRGELRREGGSLALSAQPGEGALTWLRLSTGWENIDAELTVKAVDDALIFLYLRYRSPASFLRLAVGDARLAVQERVPGLGLTGIFEYPLSELSDGKIGLTLKGQRLELRSGGRSLTARALPISPAITAGRIALGLENRSDRPEEAIFSDLHITPLPPYWLTARVGQNPAEGEEEWRESGATVLLAPVTGNVATLLLTAANAGLKTYARLPAGSTDLDLLAQSLGRLPSRLAGSVWDGVAFRPKAGEKWDALAGAFARARELGLETALIVGSSFAREAAGELPDWHVDWLLFDADVPSDLRERMDRVASGALIEEEEGNGRYKPIGL